MVVPGLLGILFWFVRIIVKSDFLLRWKGNLVKYIIINTFFKKINLS